MASNEVTKMHIVYEIVVSIVTEHFKEKSGELNEGRES
jgi:hypothetical protein